VRVLISADMEGIAGVVAYDDVLPGRPDYERNRSLMTAEVSAGVRGALAYDPGAEVLVADAHADGRNLLPAELDRRARLIRGEPRPGGMLAGIAAGVDAVVLIGQHAQAGTADAVLAHSVNGRAILEVRCNGQALGEVGLNVAYAAAHGTTVVLATGDDAATAEAEQFAPGVRTVAVKRALGGWAAECLHPEEARRLIETATTEALAARADIRPARFDGPVELEIDLIRPVFVEPLLLIPGMLRNGGRGLRYRAESFEQAYEIVLLVAMVSPPLAEQP
jgi:D-amino peptidase